MTKTYSLAEIDTFAVSLLPLLKSNVVLLDGEMGAGKTTLIKALCKALNCTDVVSSPTFSLINEYRTAENQTLYHFDCYRIENEEEAYDFGAEEYLYSGNKCFVEWAENIQSLLPENYSKIILEKMDELNRKITLI